MSSNNRRGFFGLEFAFKLKCCNRWRKYFSSLRPLSVTAYVPRLVYFSSICRNLFPRKYKEQWDKAPRGTHCAYDSDFLSLFPRYFWSKLFSGFWSQLLIMLLYNINILFCRYLYFSNKIDKFKKNIQQILHWKFFYWHLFL